MRAVVLAIRGNQAAVAEMGGGMRYIENRAYEPGQILELKNMRSELDAMDNKAVSGAKVLSFPARAGHFVARYGTSVAAAVAMIAVTGAVTVNAAPAYRVTLDVNPSVAMDLNIFDRVVGTASNNNDGEEIITSVSGELLGRKIDKALDKTLDAMRDASYITKENTPAVSTVSGGSEKGRERIKKELEETAEAWNAIQDRPSVDLAAVEVSEELAEEAREQGITPGRVILNKEIERREMEEKAAREEKEAAEERESQESFEAPVNEPAEPQSRIQDTPEAPQAEETSREDSQKPEEAEPAANNETPAAQNEAPVRDEQKSSGQEAPKDNGREQTPPQQDPGSGQPDQQPMDNRDNTPPAQDENRPGDTGEEPKEQDRPTDQPQSGNDQVPPASESGSDGGQQTEPANSQGSQEPAPPQSDQNGQGASNQSSAPAPVEQPGGLKQGGFDRPQGGGQQPPAPQGGRLRRPV